MASKKNNYFLIGLFVLIGLSLIVIAIVYWGAKDRTKDVVYAETYFDESVQGLSQGSAVKYRGMQIGSVVDIAAINNIYNINPTQGIYSKQASLLGAYVYVKMAISSRFLNITSEEAYEEKIKKAVENGLRAKLSIQGLTGSAFINLDFEDAKSKPSLPISWQPQYSYIPSTTSTLAFFGDNAEYLLNELRKIDLPKTFNEMQNLIKATNQTIDNSNKFLANSNKQIMEMLANFESISQNIKQISERAKEHPSNLIFSSPPPTLDLNKL